MTHVFVIIVDFLHLRPGIELRLWYDDDDEPVVDIIINYYIVK